GKRLPWPQSQRRLSILGLLGIAAITSSCDSNPFAQVPISGIVHYEDGSTIPATSMKLWFTSLAPAKDERTHPRPASAPVDIATGAIGQATTYRYEDGVIQGKHRVHLDLDPPNLVPRQFTSAATTTLEVDTSQLPWDIQIPKPR
ncbi:MAG TPA: hypothetical protein VIY86_10810, partial [Pirellulaceae bacterium]